MLMYLCQGLGKLVFLCFDCHFLGRMCRAIDIRDKWEDEDDLKDADTVLNRVKSISSEHANI